MKKLTYLISLFTLLVLSACATELETKSENSDALLREIGQSEAFIKMTTSTEKSHDVYMSIDRERYVAIMEKAGYGMCDVWEKGIPSELHEVEGAIQYLEIMKGFCEGRDMINKSYPNFWNLTDEEWHKLYEYRNQAIGFDPTSLLAKQ